MKRKRFIGSGGVLVAIGVAVALWVYADTVLKDPYSDHLLKRVVLGPSLYYRFVYSGVFDGQPVELNQLVECRPVLASGGLGGGTYHVYERLPIATGHRFEDGSALFFKIPSMCERNIAGGDWRVSDTTDVLPVTYWTDDLDEPTIVELYSAPAYYEQPEARLDIGSSQLEFLPPSFQPDEKPQQPFLVPMAVLPPDLERWKKKYPDMFMGGWRLAPLHVPVPLDDTIRGILTAEPPEFISARGRFEAYRMPPELQAWRSERKVARARARYLGPLNIGQALNFPDIVTQPQEIEDLRQGTRLFNEIVPFVWIGDDDFEIDFSRKGLAVYQNGKDIYSIIAEGKKSTFIIDGDIMEFDLSIKDFGRLRINWFIILDIHSGDFYLIFPA